MELLASYFPFRLVQFFHIFVLCRSFLCPYTSQVSRNHLKGEIEEWSCFKPNFRISFCQAKW
jgi:hypothetical protein